MSTFDGFTHEARLYAEHEAVVDEMRKRLRADADAFWRAVQAELALRLAPLNVALEKLSEGASYSYLRVKSGSETIAEVWVKRDDGRLVRDATVLIGFGLPIASTNQAALAAGADVANSLAAPNNEPKKLKATAGTLFQIDAVIADKSLVEGFADLVGPILARLVGIAQGRFT